MKEDPIYRTFYLTKQDQKNRLFTDIYNETMEEVLTYYNEYGKDGFLSERMSKEDIPDIVNRKAKMKQHSESCELVLESVIINRRREDEERKAIESKPNFSRWVTKDDIMVASRKE